MTLSNCTFTSLTISLEDLSCCLKHVTVIALKESSNRILSDLIVFSSRHYSTCINHSVPDVLSNFSDPLNASKLIHVSQQMYIRYISTCLKYSIVKVLFKSEPIVQNTPKLCLPAKKVINDQYVWSDILIVNSIHCEEEAICFLVWSDEVLSSNKFIENIQDWTTVIVLVFISRGGRVCIVQCILFLFNPSLMKRVQQKWRSGRVILFYGASWKWGAVTGAATP